MTEEIANRQPRKNVNLSVAEAFCNQYPYLAYSEQQDLFFLYGNGYYQPLTRQKIHTLVLEKCTATQYMSDSNQKHTINQIARIKRREPDEFNDGKYINFTNGLYSVEEKKLYPHTKDYLSTIRIPYQYDPSAKCFLWMKTLEEIFEGDNNPIRTLQEFFGYCFVRHARMQKALVLIGMGGTGKSTIAQILRDLVGLENCTALSLRHFSDNTMIGVLNGKMANIVEEVPKKIEDYETEFCNVVTGGEVQVNPKYLNSYKFYPFCKLLFCCNKFPYIDDDTNAFYRRLLILKMDKIFKEEQQNKSLPEQLRGELSGIFNWAMEGLTRLNERGYFAVDEYMKREIDYLQEANNPIRTYLKENIMVVEKAQLVKRDAYEHYKNWCAGCGYKPMGITKFSAEVYMTYRAYTKNEERETSGDRRSMWRNLAFRTLENEILGNKEGIDWKE